MTQLSEPTNNIGVAAEMEHGSKAFVVQSVGGSIVGPSRYTVGISVSCSRL